MKIKFIRNPKPGEGGEGFNAGKIADLPEPSAERWIRRGAAVVVSQETASHQGELDTAADDAPASGVRKARRGK